jgi:bacillithiol system protein YtxJ
MFGWWPFKFKREGSRGAALPEIGRNTNLDTLTEQDVIVLFKHSGACPVSWAAHAQMMRFRTGNPQVPVYLVPVLRERAVSQQIARRFNVPHASPQVIVLRRGVVVGSASHGAITESHLTEMLAAAAARAATPAL